MMKGWTESFDSDEALFVIIEVCSFTGASMRTIGLACSYDGTNYFGFQTQPGENTVQDKLEAAIARLTGQDIRIHGSGRTDSGVHARKQVVSFITDSKIPIERWAMALNTLLPKDIVVFAAKEMPDHFHAQKSAVHKTYRYSIWCGKYPDPFLRRTSFHHWGLLDVERMSKGLTHLLGTHDFTSFASTRGTKECKVRTIYDAHIECSTPFTGFQAHDGFEIHVYITGSGFLYNMVRIIVGTLLQVGEGRRSPEEIKSILEGKKRSLAGPTALPHALTLWDVNYGELEIP
jgi:tRNA pseudouridine38-40 synthase